MKQLVRNSITIALTEGVLILVAIARNKYLAVTIGPEGFGMVNILTSFFGMIAGLSYGWLTTGTVRFICDSRESGNPGAARAVVRAALALGISATAVAGISVVLLQNLVRTQIIGVPVPHVAYFSLVGSLAAGCFGLIATNTLQGLMSVRRSVFGRLLSGFSDITLVVAFVSLMSLDGYFLSIFVSSTVSAGIGWHMVRMALPKGDTPANTPTHTVVTPLLRYAGYDAVLGILTPASHYAQRRILLHHFPLDTLGFVQAASGIMNYVGILQRASHYTFFPSVCGERDPADLSRKLNEYVRFSALTSFPLAIAAIMLAEPVVSLLYSRHFAPLSEYVAYFVLAQYVLTLTLSYQALRVGGGLLRLHLWITVITQTTWVVIPLVFARRFGVLVIPASLIMGAAVDFAISSVYWKRCRGVTMGRRETALFFSSLCLVVSAIPVAQARLSWRADFVAVSLIVLAPLLLPELRAGFAATATAYHGLLGRRRP